jgi:hypothetical protein
MFIAEESPSYGNSPDALQMMNRLKTVVYNGILLYSIKKI